MSAVEDVATAIAATVRAKGWEIHRAGSSVYLHFEDETVAALICKDASQAARLAEMMRAPTPVFDAMNLPETPAFPSLRGKA